MIRLQPSSVDRLAQAGPTYRIQTAATIVLMRAATHVMHDPRATYLLSEAYDRLRSGL